MVDTFGSFILIFLWFDGNVRFIIPLFTEYYSSINLCKQGVILTNTDVCTRMVNGSPLPDQDISCFYQLASIQLNAQSFAF